METSGTVIGTKTESPLHKRKHLLEIEIEGGDERLLSWQSKRVSIRALD